VIEIVSGVMNDGKLTAWEFHNYNSGGSAIRTPYEVPNQKVEFHSSRSPLRQAHIAHWHPRPTSSPESRTWRARPRDQNGSLEFRLKNLKDDRMRAVLEKAASSFGWGKAKAGDGRGFGLACGTEKGSFVATCAEVNRGSKDR
jgi:isoquinoline 1-oxidoreductase